MSGTVPKCHKRRTRHDAIHDRPSYPGLTQGSGLACEADEKESGRCAFDEGTPHRCCAFVEGTPHRCRWRTVARRVPYRRSGIDPGSSRKRAPDVLYEQEQVQRVRGRRFELGHEVLVERSRFTRLGMHE